MLVGCLIAMSPLVTCSNGQTCVSGTCVGGAGGAGDTPGTGGASGTGGSSGAGGSGGTTCGTYAVSSNGFVTTPANDGACWHGGAFLGGDPGSTIMPKDFSACGAGCVLRMTGTVNAATAAENFLGNVFLGFNVAQDATSTPAGTVMPTGTGLIVAFANNSAATTLRVHVVTATGASWCYPLTGASPVTVPYAMMNAACWDNTGTFYAKQPISSIQLMIPGQATAADVDVTLVSVTEY
jgi:hypothetical protein